MDQQVAKNLSYAAAISLALWFLSATELTYINGKVAAIILVSGALTTLAFSVLHREREGAVNDGQQEVIELKAAGMEAKRTGRAILGENTLVLIFFCALSYFGYVHHTSNEEALRRVYEATVENTYVLSLSQPEREKLQIAMPESLRRKLRIREQP